MRLLISLSGSGHLQNPGYSSWRNYTEQELHVANLGLFGLPVSAQRALLASAPKNMVPRSFFIEARRSGYQPIAAADYDNLSDKDARILKAIQTNASLPYPIMRYDSKHGKYDMIAGGTAAALIDGMQGLVKAIYLTPEHVEQFMKTHKE